jgi:predicted RNA binding protein YcfA (HicA-like mRNA interferase family)
MSKNEMMKIRKFKDFERILKQMGYTEQTGNSGSHRIYKCNNRPTLSIPCHHGNDEIAPGTRRNIIKLVLA